MTMQTLADHIIAVAQQNEKSINKYKLEKIMYFTLKTANKDNLITQDELEAIYDEPFLLHFYGPKLISQSERFEIFRGAPIIGSGFEISPELNKFNQIILEYLEKPVMDLVKESRETPFWRKNSQYLNGIKSDIPYGLDDL